MFFSVLEKNDMLKCIIPVQTSLDVINREDLNMYSFDLKKFMQSSLIIMFRPDLTKTI